MRFSIVKDHVSIIQLWAHQWKMAFNPDLSKQATEVYFLARNLVLIIRN